MRFGWGFDNIQGAEKHAGSPSQILTIGCNQIVGCSTKYLDAVIVVIGFLSLANYACNQLLFHFSKLENILLHITDWIHKYVCIMANHPTVGCLGCFFSCYTLRCIFLDICVQCSLVSDLLCCWSLRPLPSLGDQGHSAANSF